MPPPQAAAIDDAPVVFTHQQILKVITGILLCILLAALDQTVVVPAVPAIAEDLKAFGHLSWIVSAYLLTSTAATPIYGKLSDSYGRRALLLPALALFIVASALCALSQSLTQLIIFRALQGLGGAGLMSMAQAAIADVVSPRERGRYQGYMAGTWGVASVAGPVVGGWVTDHLSWTYVFWVNVPLGLLAMWLCNRALKVLPVRRLGGKIDFVGAALLTACVTSVLLVMSWGGTEYRWVSAPILGLLALAVVLLVALVWTERHVADAILPPRMFSQPVFTRGMMLSFITSIGLLGTTFLLPLYFQLVRGVDAESSGLLVTPYLLTSVAGAFAGGQIARRLGRTKVTIVAGFACSCVGFAGLSLLSVDTPIVVVMAWMSLPGFGIGVTLPNVLITVQNAAERRDVGTATGALLFLRSLGGAFGSTLVGALLTGIFGLRLAARGFPNDLDLGALKPDGLLDRLGPAAMQAGRTALTSGFDAAFAICLLFFLVALGVAFGLRDLPLRTVASSAPEDTPGALGH